MKLVFLIASFLIGISSFSQIMRVGAGGLVFEDGKGTSLNPAVFSDCWCEVSKSDSLGKPTVLKPLSYPLAVEINGQWKFLSEKGELTSSRYPAEISFQSKDGDILLKGAESNNFVWKKKENSALELLDSLGQVKTTYHIQDFHSGGFLVTIDSLSWGIVNSNLIELLPLEYIAAHHEGKDFRFSSKGYLSIRKNEAGSSFGVVNSKGKTILPFKWKLITYVIEDEEHIYAMNNYLKRGYINIKGETTLPFKYSSIPREVKDSNLVKTEHYTYFLDKNLKQIGPKYQSYERKGKVYFFKRDNKWGILDANHKEILPNVYSSIMDGPRMKGNPEFKCYIVVKNGFYGLITTTGETIIKASYECLCGLSYYAPASYYIEFKKADVSYKFNEKGELIEKGGTGSKACFCE
jgi:hypothetical protein